MGCTLSIGLTQRWSRTIRFIVFSLILSNQTLSNNMWQLHLIDSCLTRILVLLHMFGWEKSEWIKVD